MRIHRPLGPGASPLPSGKDNRTNQTHLTIPQLSIGGNR